MRRAALLALVPLLPLLACRDTKPSVPLIEDSGQAATADAATEALSPIADGGSETGRTPSLGYGIPRTLTGSTCAARGEGHFISETDERTTFVDGRDLLALVNRSPTGALAADFAPSDLVDLRSHAPRTEKECEAMPCLRKDAAVALDELLLAMQKRGFPGSVESTFRSYRAQCVTFSRWVAQSNFCSATEQSALPGHSQHQLGTAIDLFTEQWRKDGDGGVFRNGFGCTPAGAFLRDEAYAFGFILPYPIFPDDSASAENAKRSACDTRRDSPVPINPMTGYRNESWHIRFIGKPAASAYAAAVKERGSEFTLEQWLREQRGIHDVITLPVCDGCNCGACSTLAVTGKTPCKNHALLLAEDGNPRAAGDLSPTIERASAEQRRGELRIDLHLQIPEGTVTQPPVATLSARLLATTQDKHVPEATSHRGGAVRSFPDLAGTVRIGVGFGTGSDYPTRLALAERAPAEVYNRINTRLPAETGKVRLRLALVPSEPDKEAPIVRVALLRDGKVLSFREIAVHR